MSQKHVKLTPLIGERSQAVELASSARFSDAPDAPEHARNAHYIRREIQKEGDRLRAKYPILQRRHEDTLSLLIMFGSIAGMVLTGWGYLAGVVPGWAAFFINALLASFIHELEHDLLHWMYFRKKPFLHNLMLFLGLVARPTTVLPWFRRPAHLTHHQHSGQEEDLEERSITNGEKWNILRFLMMFDLPTIFAVHVTQFPTLKEKVSYALRVTLALFPLGVISWICWYMFLGFHLGNLLFAPEWSASTLARMEWINPFVVLMVAPNIWRSFCLHFLSSNMHYYGDIDRNNVIQQTQVLDAWYFFPLQLFSCNVGKTHGIHHFVVREPFWIRQFTMKRAHEVMREGGVRFNDLGTFRRANRWNEPEADDSKELDRQASLA